MNMIATPVLVVGLAAGFMLYATRPALASIVLAGVVALMLLRQGHALIAAGIGLLCLVAISPQLGGALLLLACAAVGFALIFGWRTR